MSKRGRTMNEKVSKKRSKPLQNDTEGDDNEQTVEETDVRNLILNKPTKKTVVRRKEEGRDETMKPGVMYLGHIPHGFFEKQIKQFFRQFGRITRLRIARNARTGQSKGYAFIEFECDEVAQIAAETMNNYIMFGRVLKCHVVPPEKQHPHMWRGANRRKVQKIPYQFLASLKANKTRTEEEQQKHVRRLLKREEEKRAKLAALNIDYDFSGYNTLLNTKGAAEKKKQAASNTKNKRASLSAGRKSSSSSSK
eukprot:TRINITY_DN13035_c0_g1_i1.p1 TRINITY_DN13035_c0_g1~~TRINITY_DN13035_c0_g1_i1.p1  ORF type:complete len:284 (+),score=92.34 TRINITY_DN13035_c0_g1_i1:97-852(+)